MGGEEREKIGIRYLHVRTFSEIIDYRVSYIYFTIKKEGRVEKRKKEREWERERERERERDFRK